MWSQRRGKGILGRGDSMDKGLEARLSGSSNFLTETLSSMSLFPRPLHQPPDTLCFSFPAFFINHQDSSGLLGTKWVPAGLWEEPGKCWLAEVGVGRKGWASRKTCPQSRLLTRQDSQPGHPALFLSSCHLLPDRTTPFPVCSLWPPT